jgi:hypothetical protein
MDKRRIARGAINLAENKTNLSHDRIKKNANAFKLKKSIMRGPITSRWEYDPFMPSLTVLPFEVLQTHLLAVCDNRTIFRLFSTCKLFHEMIGYPTAKRYSRWNLTPLMIAKLRLGHDSGWIQGVNYYF